MWFASLRVITNDSIVKGGEEERGRAEEEVGRDRGNSWRERGKEGGKAGKGKRWHKWMDGWLQFRGREGRED